MPETVSVGDTQLRLNGMGLSTKKVVFVTVKVAVMGLYLETPRQDSEAVIASDEAKRISIAMLRDVDRKAFVDAVVKGMERSAGARMPALRQRLAQMTRVIPNVKKGDVLHFTYVPGVGTVAQAPGQEVVIAGKDFADALFSVWLGPLANDTGLRSELLGR